MEIKRFIEEHGTALRFIHGKVKRLGCCPEWEDFDEFCNWCLLSGYVYASRLYKFNRDDIYSPENCTWEKAPTIGKTAVNEWNATVNQIRSKLGKDPLKVSCKDCAHRKVCKYVADGMGVCDEYLYLKHSHKSQT